MKKFIITVGSFWILSIFAPVLVIIIIPLLCFYFLIKFLEEKQKNEGVDLGD